MSCSMAPDVLQQPPTVAPPPRPVRTADLDRRTPAEEPESSRWLRQVDLAVMGLGALLRTLFYGAVYAVATRWDFGPSMLGGMLAGDLVGSVGTLAWDWRRRGIAAVVELLLVAMLATWWWTRADGALAHPGVPGGVGAGRFRCVHGAHQRAGEPRRRRQRRPGVNAP
jgi:hypothetical protein